jgi:uncharacterized membrane protein affecting hemolysin expression
MPRICRPLCAALTLTRGVSLTRLIFMLFTHLYRAYPQLSLCTLLIVLLGLLGSGLYLYHGELNQREQANNYGQVLAQSAARQAVEATLNQDLISLQAILQEVAQYPRVVGASIRNVENKLLVQSGHHPHQQVTGTRYQFTAPIALHNNIAGYLQVTVEVPRHSGREQQFLFIWLCAVSLALLIIWWSIQMQWWRNLRDKLPAANRVFNLMLERIPTIPEAPPEPAPKEPDLPPSPQVGVRLNIHLTNMSRLYQQLNAEGFSLLLRRFEKQLQDVLTLYNGQRLLLTQDVLIIDFIGESYHDCSFRALCSARLLSNLCARAPSPRLQVSASIQEVAAPLHRGTQSLLRDFVAQQNHPLHPERGDILICPHLRDENLLQRAEVDASGKLLDIKPPYSELLAKQEERLATL